MDQFWRVVYSEVVRNEIKELHIRAKQAGAGTPVLAALREIDYRLHSDAANFGEPKFHYRELKLQLRIAIEPPLVVHFAVHEELPIVFVKAIRPLPGQGV